MRDRRDPSIVSELAAALSRPRPIDEVETIEAEAKELWHDILLGEDPKGEAAAFAEFFNRIGLLYKYKSYGTKIATPFGYSLFDLHEREGFSWQLHREPKLEAFHVLKPLPGAFVYLSTVEEWEAAGREAAAAWKEDVSAVLDSAFAFDPEPGDVFTIDTTEVVHTVVGCVVEEYASCSVDAVERLFDQNEGRPVDLPAAHPDVTAILGGAFNGVPARKVERSATGWTQREAPPNGAVADLPGKLRGGRVSLAPGGGMAVELPAGHVGVVVVLAGDVSCAIEGTTITAGVAELLPLPSLTPVQITAGPNGATLARHSVSGELLMRDWTR